MPYHLHFLSDTTRWDFAPRVQFVEHNYPKLVLRILGKTPHDALVRRHVSEGTIQMMQLEYSEATRWESQPFRARFTAVNDKGELVLNHV
jgi:hypothetical protein